MEPRYLHPVGATCSVLVIGPSESLNSVLAYAIEQHGYATDTVADYSDGLRRWVNDDPDLVVIDVDGLLDGGRDYLENVRKSVTSDFIVLSKDPSEEAELNALNCGAIDYQVKSRLLATALRVRNALIRQSVQVQLLDDQLRAVGLHLDERKARLEYQGAHVRLTPKETQLLKGLLLRRDAVAESDVLIHHVWGQVSGAYGNLLKSHIFNLRRKLKAIPALSESIETIEGVGYTFHTPRQITTSGPEFVSAAGS